jgi:hypothetical protein
MGEWKTPRWEPDPARIELTAVAGFFPGGPVITDTQIIQRLRENNLRYVRFELQNGVFLIVAERGGRVLGPFTQPGTEGIYWLNPLWADAGAFTQAIRAGEWNLGGERVWIAPEIQYIVQDRRDFWGSIHLPAQMDPGCFRLSRPAENMVTLENELTLTAYNLAAGEKSLRLRFSLHPIDNPLRCLPDFTSLMSGVTYGGYEQVVTLAEEKTTSVQSESWNLVQLNPGGTLFIQSGPQMNYHDYFEPVDSAHQQIGPHGVSVRITGQRRFKTGYSALHVTGRVTYINSLADGNAYLLVRNFYNNPSAPYIEEPPHLPGAHGDSIHVYNDGGAYGGYGEVEVHGQTIGGATGRSASTDAFGLWLYVGEPVRLARITAHLSGMSAAEIDF